MSAARVSGWPSRLYKRLRFWDKLPNAKVLSEAERETAWDRIRTMRPAARQMFIDALIRQNARVAADIESVANRGTALLTATGVISGVLALLVPVGAAIQGRLHAPSIFAFGLLILAGAAFVAVVYCALATVVLAIRSQEVGYFSLVEMRPGVGESALAYELDYAYQLYLAYSDNDSRLTVLVSYLRDAQAYFRGLAQALTMLVVISAMAIASSAFVAGSAVGPSSRPGPTPSVISSAVRSGP